MRVRSLHLKPRRGGAMVRVDRATAIAGRGLDGDCNASAASPRQVLLVSGASVRRLGLAADDLRANLVVELDVDALPSGTVLRIGDARIRLTLACEPCRRLETVRAGLAREVGRGRGTLGRVITGGALREGDPILVEDTALPALAERWQARVVDILGQLPDGMTVTFARLAEIAGLQPSYCRAFPPLFRRLDPTALPLDRVVGGRAPARRPWDGASYYAGAERYQPTPSSNDANGWISSRGSTSLRAPEK